MLQIDHVAIITPNLATTAWQLRVAGLETYDGGYNYIREGGIEKAATAHRDVPLNNDQYIEVEQLIDNRAVDDVEEDLPKALAALRDRALREGPFLITYWVVSDDFEAHRRRLGLAEQIHQRLRTDGFMIKGRTAPRTIDALEQGVPPFFEFLIPDDEHPGRRRVNHSIQPSGIAWVEVGGDRKRIEEWLGPEANSLPLSYVGGEAGVRAVGVALANGDVIEIRPGGGSLGLRRIAAGDSDGQVTGWTGACVL